MIFLFKRIAFQLRRSPFIKPVGKLVSGSLMSQMITLACMLVITRLFSTADFGAFASLLSFSTILSVIASGRYEFAVMNPSKDEAAAAIIAVSLGLSLIFSLTIALVIIPSVLVLETLGKSPQTHLVYFLPVLVLVQSWYQILVKWNNRQKSYSAITSASIILAIGINGLQILFGLTYQVGAAALALAYLFGNLLAIALLLVVCGRSFSRGLQGFDLGTVRKTLSDYWRFPVFTMPHGLASKGVAEMPIVFLAGFFGAEMAGLFALTRRVLNKPTQLIGTNVGLVLHQRISQAAMSGRSTSYREILVVVLAMGVLMIPVSAIILAYGERLFVLCFGKEWAMAGLFAKIMLPLLVFRMMAVPLGPVFLVFNRQRQMLFLQFFHIGITFLAYWGGTKIGSVYWALSLHAFGSSIAYGLVVFFALRLVRPLGINESD